MKRSIVLLLLLVPLSSCERRKKPPLPEPESVPPRPVVDEGFLAKALGPGTKLANKPVIDDIDRRSGTEALVAVHKDGRNYEVAVVRGNHEVLGRTPLGGKILSNANIQAIGEFRRLDLWKDSKTYLMPVETLVYHRSVCGLVAFRYRYDTLSVDGEFATLCWRKEASGHGGDPFKDFKVIRDDAGKLLRVETIDDRGQRIYTWDAAKQAFTSRTVATDPSDKPPAKPPAGSK